MWSLRSSHPVLITGNDGCGKSECVSSFGSLFGSEVNVCCLTPETEPSYLVGQLMPKQDKKIEWENGEMTKAYLNGNWILLDNINQAEASVLERLNPIMEEPAVWTLTENGEINPLPKRDV